MWLLNHLTGDIYFYVFCRRQIDFKKTISYNVQMEIFLDGHFQKCLWREHLKTCVNDFSAYLFICAVHADMS